MLAALNTPEQVHDTHSERLGHQVQTGKRDVHPTILECSDLCPMKPRKVCKLILRPSALEP